MKRFLQLTFLATILFISVKTTQLNAQWEPNALIGTAFSSSLASSGSSVNIVYNKNFDIYCKNSSDYGASFSSEVLISSVPQVVGLSPSIASTSTNVYSVWIDIDTVSDSRKLKFSKSTNNGAIWSTPIDLASFGLTGNHYTAIVASGSSIHVAWKDSDQINYIRSTNDGLSWSGQTEFTVPLEQSFSPSLAISGTDLHLTWWDLSFPGPNPAYQIKYARSTNLGVSWFPTVQLTSNNDSLNWNPSVSASENNVYLTYTRNIAISTNPVTIYFVRSTNGGSTWSSESLLKYNSDNSRIASSGNNVHVVESINSGLNYKSSTNNGLNWYIDTILTNYSGFAFPNISLYGTQVNTIWTQFNNQVYYKRNPSGNPIGIANINSEIPDNFSLFQNYPNPFNPTTNIRFNLKKSGFVKIMVYDILGREKASLVNEELNAGTYQVDFDASNLSSGVYFYKMITEDFVETKKMVLMK